MARRLPPRVAERSPTARMPSPRDRRCIPLAIALAAFAMPAYAAPMLVGVSFADGMLYDVDATTGAASNPRQIRALPCDDPCGDPAVDLVNVAGIEIASRAPDELILLTTVATPAFPDDLMRAPLADPIVAFPDIEPAGTQIGEGDITIQPSTGALFAIGLTNMIAPFTLVRLDTVAGPTILGEIGTSDISGLAFDVAGTLYALDTGADALLVLDPTDASTLSSVALSAPLGALAGMDLDPATGTLYVADGGSGGTDMLYTLDPATGALAAIGPLGLANGLSGLAVPEPDEALLAIVAGAALAAIAVRRR